MRLVLLIRDMFAAAPGGHPGGRRVANGFQRNLGCSGGLQGAFISVGCKCRKMGAVCWNHAEGCAAAHARESENAGGVATTSSTCASVHARESERETGAYRNRQCELRASRKWERLPPARTKARDGRTCASALDIARQSRYNEIGCPTAMRREKSARRLVAGRNARGGKWDAVRCRTPAAGAADGARRAGAGGLLRAVGSGLDSRRPRGAFCSRGGPCGQAGVSAVLGDGGRRRDRRRGTALAPRCARCAKNWASRLRRRLGRFSSASAGRATSPTSGCFAGKARWRR